MTKHGGSNELVNDLSTSPHFVPFAPVDAHVSVICAHDDHDPDNNETDLAMQPHGINSQSSTDYSTHEERVEIPGQMSNPASGPESLGTSSGALSTSVSTFSHISFHSADAIACRTANILSLLRENVCH